MGTSAMPATRRGVGDEKSGPQSYRWTAVGGSRAATVPRCPSTASAVMGGDRPPSKDAAKEGRSLATPPVQSLRVRRAELHASALAYTSSYRRPSPPPAKMRPCGAAAMEVRATPSVGQE